MSFSLSSPPFLKSGKRHKVEDENKPENDSKINSEIRNVISSEDDKNVLCMEHFINTDASWYSSESRIPLFFDVSTDDSNTLKSVTKDPINETQKKNLEKTVHIVTTSLFFLRHMKDAVGVNIYNAYISNSSGYGAPRWHSDGGQHMARKLLVALSKDHVNHTEFMTIGNLESERGHFFSRSCGYKNPGIP